MGDEKLKSVIKRDKSKVDFDSSKVEIAVLKAFIDVYPMKDKSENARKAAEIANIVVERLNSINKSEVDVEYVQDTVENVLMQNEPQVAKAYILYRNKRSEIRSFRRSLGIPNDDLKVPINSLIVLAARYLIKDEAGKIVESPKQLFIRVARAVASAAKKFSEQEGIEREYEDKFYDMMATDRFMPNSPTLMNAGTREGQLSACFVIPVGDSIPEIYDAIKYQALIHKTGGGTGFAFSRLRPSNDFVRSTHGVASGPISFMKIFDASTEEIKQGGKRRGANMGILKVDHPNILDFIMLKENEGVLRNFNISVGVTDVFMKAVKENMDYKLLNPRTNVVVGKLNARAVWSLIVTMAWKTGDPGIVFLDRINSSYSNPVPAYGPIESTNPCITGETLINTTNGIFTANELYLKNKSIEVIVDSRFGAGPVQAASPVIKTGTKSVIRLITKEGYQVKLTPDHKVYSNSRGWIEAKNLEKGERIRISDTGGAFGSEGTEEEGRVLGWLVGDGHINPGAGNKRAVLSFYGEDAELAEPFAEYVNKIIRPSVSFNGRNVVSVVDIEKRKMRSIASERLKEYAAQYGLVEDKLQVPDKVLRGSIGMQKGFLQALFEADGTVLHSKNLTRQVRLTSISSELLNRVQIMLLNFGIYSKIYKNRKAAQMKQMPGHDGRLKTYQTKAVHELCIYGSALHTFAEKMGFLSERKNRRLLNAIVSYTKGPYERDAFATVIEMQGMGIEDVYDLTEPTTHSFVANGIVVHNCGEQPLYPYDSCNLGSINLAKMVKGSNGHAEIDWGELKEMTRLATRFLDDVVEVNSYPLPEIDRVSRAIRRIGLGVMGWADMLIKLGIRYDSNEALVLAEKVMSFITHNARKMSEELAVERGAFPEFQNSIWSRLGTRPLRNSTVTTIAPTGTISIIAGGTSQGIEPIFSVVYIRNVSDSLGSNLIEVNNEFEAYAMERGFYSEELMQKLANTVSIQGFDEIPEDIRKLFVTAHDIAPEWHVKMQAAFQKYTDNGVSKTINFPNWATPQDIENSYGMAWNLGCKGITVYRDASKSVQVLQSVGGHTPQKTLDSVRKAHERSNEELNPISISALSKEAETYSLIVGKEERCPECGGVMIPGSGCFTCPRCSYSKCE